MSLDVVGPLQVFASANAELARLGQADAYEVSILAEEPGPVPCSGGFALVADAAWPTADVSAIDTLLVPGGDIEAQLRNVPLLHWLRHSEPRLRRLGSICSGALVLGKAGLLVGRRVTTHWDDIEALRTISPRAEVVSDLLHTYDPRSDKGANHLFTSAGVTSGIDLALALVEDDLGHLIASAIARRLVMFMRRPAGQTQFSSFLAAGATRSPRLASLIEWIPGNLGADLSVSALAEMACMQPRTMTRAFQRELGMSPGRYVEKVRIEAASALLSHGKTSVAMVAQLCGFNHPENLRRTFQKYVSVSPKEFSDRFGFLNEVDGVDLEISAQVEN